MKYKIIKYLKYGLLGVVGMALNLFGLTILDVPLTLSGWEMFTGVVFIYGSFYVWSRELK